LLVAEDAAGLASAAVDSKEECHQKDFNRSVRQDSEKFEKKNVARTLFFTPCSEFENLLRALHQRARNHVVQRLFAFSKSRHDVADEQNHAGD
jgi:hypothetical protein